VVSRRGRSAVGSDRAIVDAALSTAKHCGLPPWTEARLQMLPKSQVVRLSSLPPRTAPRAPPVLASSPIPALPSFGFVSGQPSSLLLAGRYGPLSSLPPLPLASPRSVHRACLVFVALLPPRVYLSLSSPFLPSVPSKVNNSVGPSRAHEYTEKRRGREGKRSDGRAGGRTATHGRHPLPPMFILPSPFSP